MRIEHRRRDDARRRRGNEGFDEARFLFVERAAEIVAFFFHRGLAGVADLAGRLRRMHQVHLHSRGITADERRQESRVASQIAHERTLTLAGKPRHPMLHVGEKALA